MSLAPTSTAHLEGALTNARWTDYLELTKPRLSLLSVITALVGYVAAKPEWHTGIFVSVVVGTMLCAGGVAALNQWMEADTDAKMRRTAQRPIPAGKIAPGSAFVLGWLLCATGLGVLFVKVSGSAAFFALATIVCYLALYTPAKRSSRWSTEIGAVAGALPPLIGWAASESSQTGLGWFLFGLLFCWQMPHFMAIAWIYRQDYEAVHFPMLSVRDHSGSMVAGYSFVMCIAAVAISASLRWSAHASMVYLMGTLLLGAWFIWRAARFTSRTDRVLHARKLFLASVTWLPLQLLLLVGDRLLLAA